VAELQSSDGDRRLRRKLFIALELAVGQRLPDCFLDLALRRNAKRLEELPDAGVEDVLVHGCFLFGIELWNTGGDRRFPAAEA
jgi:hypothetical protein